jgi:thymidylate synthase (FAD)
MNTQSESMAHKHLYRLTTTRALSKIEACGLARAVGRSDDWAAYELPGEPALLVDEPFSDELRAKLSEEYGALLWQPMKRTASAALDAELGRPYPLLDHGFIRLVDYMGDQTSIVRAARVSYGRGTKTVSEDKGLIRYLVRHRHNTPIEMCEFVLHCKLPIFIARQWIRHRMASVNEYSARYSILDKEFYLPAPEQLATQSTTNRQGRGGVLSSDQAVAVIERLRMDALRSYESYEAHLDPAVDLARELARIGLTLAHYTQWYWKIDLHNLLHFLSLRMDGHAQHEIRVYAEAIANLVKLWVPDVWEAFEDYRLESTTLSKHETLIVRALMSEDTETARALFREKLSKREQSAFKAQWPDVAGIF